MTRWYHPPIPGVERVPTEQWLNQKAQRFMRAHRIPNEVLIDWRLGVVPKALERDLGFTGRRRLDVAGGFNIPTFHPSEPERITGFIRQNYGQLHAYAATGSRGIAGRQDIQDQTHSTIVLVDTPMLALWLALRDVRCVALVLDPAQLDGLWEWLCDRRVVIAGTSRVRTQRWRQIITGQVRRPATVRVVVLPKVYRHIARAKLDRLNQEVVFHPPPEPVLPPLPQVLGAILKVIRRDPDAMAKAVDVTGITSELASALGAIVCAVRSRWPRRYRHFISLHGWGGQALLLPARNTAGTLVDICALSLTDRPSAVMSVRREPAGVIMTNELVKTYRVEPRLSVHLVDHRQIATAGILWTAGSRYIVIVRGPVDLERNVIPMLQRRWVRQVRVHGRSPRTWSKLLRKHGIMSDGDRGMSGNGGRSTLE